MKFSVVMATMNESGCVEKMIDELRKYLPEDSEFIIVDSSNDETPKIAERKGAKIFFQPPQGHGTAIRFGLPEASGEIIITIDCDMTYQADKIPEMIKLITEEGYDVVSGCRLTPALKKEMPFLNWFGNVSFAFIVRSLFRINTHDVTTGMFVMKKEYARTPWEGNFSLPAEIIIRSKLMGKKYKEVPTTYKIRVGESKLPMFRSGRAYLRCFCYWKFGLCRKGER